MTDYDGDSPDAGFVRGGNADHDPEPMFRYLPGGEEVVRCGKCYRLLWGTGGWSDPWHHAPAAKPLDLRDAANMQHWPLR